MQRYGRDAERESDEYGMRYMSEAGYDPQGAVDLQITFVELSKERREDWLSGLFASHPPSRERVENNIRTARKLPAGGEVGRDRYLQATRHLRETKPAYEAYDAAGKALKNDDLREARRQLQRARDIEPREPLFLALEGDLLSREDKDTEAQQAYDRAIRANPSFFYPYLRKGQLEYQGGRYRSAGVALEKSTGLLPTSEALYLLGMIQKRNGNRDQAVSYLSQAAQSNSAAGKKAKEELARLQGQSGGQGGASDISRYVPTRAAQDADGYVWVQLANRADVALKNIEVEAAWIDSQGQTRRGRQRYPGPLQPGDSDQFRTEIRFPRVRDLDSRVRVEAVAAQRY
jgi:predicted Zn-dependent protease